MTTLGEISDHIRKTRISSVSLAERAGIRPEVVHRLRHHDHVDITAPEALRLAETLGLYGRLEDEEDEDNPSSSPPLDTRVVGALVAEYPGRLDRTSLARVLAWSLDRVDSALRTLDEHVRPFGMQVANRDEGLRIQGSVAVLQAAPVCPIGLVCRGVEPTLAEAGVIRYLAFGGLPVHLGDASRLRELGLVQVSRDGTVRLHPDVLYSLNAVPRYRTTYVGRDGICDIEFGRSRGYRSSRGPEVRRPVGVPDSQRSSVTGDG